MTALPRSVTRSLRAPGRRTLDVAIAVVALIILAPIMLVIAVLIRIESSGPVFFRQIRLGHGGQPFYLYKFRKFWQDAHATHEAVTLKSDPRMTRVGRILQRTKFDELPQFWNILIGDMSLVGPRPETLDFADCFQDGYRKVLDYTPGLFGPSQAIFRNESSLYPTDGSPNEYYRAVLFPAKARIDLLYYSRRTIMSDIGWTIRCILAVMGFAVHGMGLNGIETAQKWLQRDPPMSAASIVQDHGLGAVGGDPNWQ